MPRSLATTEARLRTLSACITITLNTLDVLLDTLNISGPRHLSDITRSLLEVVQTVKQDKNDAELMEHIHQLLSAILNVYIKSDTGVELSPSILNQIAKFTECFYIFVPICIADLAYSRTLHKIHTFVEAQSGSRVKIFFRQGELSTLLRGCKKELEQELNFFQIKRTTDILISAREMQDQVELRHQEVLNMIETMSTSDSASSVY
ncbi:hypothetical protein B0H16DRAFT_1529405 [Mycena metata]|uniref:Uncharacterized protein n=1 Tax=Mycena metata TaxID=1033252 RepID=A0AAD7NJB1_9AGAR|nr:hypothetical protein B0H16DRAFT_1529405 [Mycena metata]